MTNAINQILSSPRENLKRSERSHEVEALREQFSRLLDKVSLELSSILDLIPSTPEETEAPVEEEETDEIRDAEISEDSHLDNNGLTALFYPQPLRVEQRKPVTQSSETNEDSDNRHEQHVEKKDVSNGEAPQPVDNRGMVVDPLVGHEVSSHSEVGEIDGRSNQKEISVKDRTSSPIEEYDQPLNVIDSLRQEEPSADIAKNDLEKYALQPSQEANHQRQHDTVQRGNTGGSLAGVAPEESGGVYGEGVYNGVKHASDLDEKGTPTDMSGSKQAPIDVSRSDDLTTSSFASIILGNVNNGSGVGGSKPTLESSEAIKISSTASTARALLDSAHHQAPSGSGQGMIASTNQGAEGSVLRDVARAEKMTKSQMARTLEKVEAVLKESVRSKDGKSVSFRLDPPHLGRLQVDVTLRDGTLHARLTPESPEVTALLREKGAELQSMLRKLGLSVDTVTVSVTSNNTFGGDVGNFNRDNSQFQHLAQFSFEGTGRKNEFSSVASNEVTDESKSVGKKQVLNDHWVA